MQRGQMQPWGSALGEVEIICMFDIMASHGWLRYLIQPWLLRVRWLTLVLNGHDESSSLMMIIIAMEMVAMMILTMKMKRVNIGQWPGEQWPSSVSRADMRSSTREARPRKQTYLIIMMIMFRMMIMIMLNESRQTCDGSVVYFLNLLNWGIRNPYGWI